MACREYLVSSPAEKRRTPRPDDTGKLALQALRFRVASPEPAPSREAPAILRELIGEVVTEE